MTSDQERLAAYVDTWRRTADDVIALLRSLDPDEWHTPTDLPGWDVRAVAAHLAHIESELSGAEQQAVEVPELTHGTALTSRYTEAGIIARKPLTHSELVDELERAVEVRHNDLLGNPPSEAGSTPPVTPGGIGWDWETLLRNRAFDLWMHEQDIRRALDRPGGMDSPGAQLTLVMLAASLPYVVGKRVAPPVGTTVLVDVTGRHPVHVAVEVGDDGRAATLLHDPEHPTVSLRMEPETFVLLGGGRRPGGSVPVEVEGDEALARTILDSMAVTP